MNVDKFRKNDMKHHDLRTYQMMNFCLRREPLMPMMYTIKQTLILVGLFETALVKTLNKI